MDSRTGALLSLVQTGRAVEFDSNPMRAGRTAPFHLRVIYIHTSASGKQIMKVQLQLNHSPRRSIGFQKIFLQFRIIHGHPNFVIHSLISRLKWRICENLVSLGFLSLSTLVMAIWQLRNVSWIHDIDVIDCNDSIQTLLY
nr:AC3 [Sweet potato leaf curl Hubei virus]